MRPKWLSIIMLLIVVVGVAIAGSPYYYTLYVRTALILQSGAYMKPSTVQADTNSFTTTASVDTIRVVGVTAADVILAGPRQSGTKYSEKLNAYGGANGDSIFVVRDSAKTSGLQYSWVRFPVNR